MALSSEKGMLWLAVRALELCVQPAHTDTLAGPMRLVTTLLYLMDYAASLLLCRFGSFRLL